MVSEAGADRDNTILLLAPSGRDAALASAALLEAGIEVVAFATMDDLTRAITEGAGAVIVAQEALTPPELDSLSRTLGRQPPWSDLPLIVLTGAGRATEAGEALLLTYDRLSNATLLERPLRIGTLVRAAQVALRTRRRQYEIREHLKERERTVAERVALLDQQRIFLRDVLASVTEGKLRLCTLPESLPERLPLQRDPVVLTRPSLRLLRREMLRITTENGFSEDRGDDLVTAANEAAMNAVVHAGGGTASICYGGGTVQVWIEDCGHGIEMAYLPRATLERGYSSAGTFGHGFWIVLQATDRTYLMTGPSGTTVVIEQDRVAPTPAWTQGL